MILRNLGGEVIHPPRHHRGLPIIAQMNAGRRNGENAGRKALPLHQFDRTIYRPPGNGKPAGGNAPLLQPLCVERRHDMMMGIDLERCGIGAGEGSCPVTAAVATTPSKKSRLIMSHSRLALVWVGDAEGGGVDASGISGMGTGRSGPRGHRAGDRTLRVTVRRRRRGARVSRRRPEAPGCSIRARFDRD
jgi:hypothetical protein